jgi:hypothetical protein
MGLITPGAKLPFELAANKNLFTGAPIASDTHSRNPVSPIGAALLKFLPGSNVGQTSRVGPGGKHIYGPGANPYLLHILSYLGPTESLIMKKSGGIGRTQADVSPLWSYGAGVSLQHVDQAQEALMEQIVTSQEGKKMIQDLRDEGVLPQAKRRKGHTAQQQQADLLKLISEQEWITHYVRWQTRELEGYADEPQSVRSARSSKDLQMFRLKLATRLLTTDVVKAWAGDRPSLLH